jgi:hypothetical protein
MIEIIGNKGCTVHYRCSCGIKGRCMIKPLESEGTVVTNITCPLCYATERVKLIQYEENKEEAMAQGKVTWACVLHNEVTDYELQEDLDA